MVNEFENLSALHKDTDGIIWDKNDILGIQNCKTLDNAAGSIVTGVMGVVSAGLGKKFFGRSDKKDPKDIYKGCSGKYKFGTGPNNKPLNIPRCAKGKGTWGDKKNRGKQGDSLWIPAKGTPLAKALKKYGKKGVRFKDGYPVFGPFAYKQSGVKAVLDIGYFNKPENRRDDMRRARDAYREILKLKGVTNAGSWPWPPKNSKGNAPAGWTWHHHQDGRTMILVPHEIHNTGSGGVSHCGGIQCL